MCTLRLQLTITRLIIIFDRHQQISFIYFLRALKVAHQGLLLAGFTTVRSTGVQEMPMRSISRLLLLRA
jgi:hypothetical protein